MREEGHSQITPGGGVKQTNNGKKKKGGGKGPVGPPELLFKSGDNAGKYSAYDDGHVPTTAADGTALSKSMLKKLAKQIVQHTKKWDAQLAKGGPSAAEAAAAVAAANVAEKAAAAAEAAATAAAATVPLSNDNTSSGDLRVVCGTFGNRQGLRLTAEIGPFTHSFDF